MAELTENEFTLLVNSMPDNCGLFIEKEDDKMKIVLVKAEDLVELGTREDLFHIVGMWTRPFVHYFGNYLEYEHFPPETELNSEMQYRVFRWNGPIWTIISIPVAKKDLAYEAAEKAHLKLADGVPIFMGKDPILIFAATRPESLEKLLAQDLAKVFPLSNERTFTLEQKKDDGIYEPGGPQDAKILEEFEIRELWKKHGWDDRNEAWDK